VPGAGAGLVRALAGWFELANIDALLADLTRRADLSSREIRAANLQSESRAARFALGDLATAWPRIELASSVEAIAEAVAGSAWGDPGGRTPAELALGMRVAWARRVLQAAPETTDWVAGAGAVSLQELHGQLSAHAAWALAGTREPDDLWLAELGWWGRVEQDALAQGGGPQLVELVAGPRRAVRWGPLSNTAPRRRPLRTPAPRSRSLSAHCRRGLPGDRDGPRRGRVAAPERRRAAAGRVRAARRLGPGAGAGGAVGAPAGARGFAGGASPAARAAATDAARAGTGRRSVPAADHHLWRRPVRRSRSDAVRRGHLLPDVRDDVRGRRRRSADRAGRAGAGAHRSGRWIASSRTRATTRR
jgi:hypothetical protein